MSNQPNGGPAFPVPGVTGNLCRGMTLRDYFAGQALAGIMANSDLMIALDNRKQDPASCAYEIAKFMLCERAKDEP